MRSPFFAHRRWPAKAEKAPPPLAGYNQRFRREMFELLYTVDYLTGRDGQDTINSRYGTSLTDIIGTGSADLSFGRR